MQPEEQGAEDRWDSGDTEEKPQLNTGTGAASPQLVADPGRGQSDLFFVHIANLKAVHEFFSQNPPPPKKAQLQMFF
jgi:hypothetical protein